jgi:hypothetical protein
MELKGRQNGQQDGYFNGKKTVVCAQQILNY